MGVENLNDVSEADNPKRTGEIVLPRPSLLDHTPALLQKITARIESRRRGSTCWRSSRGTGRRSFAESL